MWDSDIHVLSFHRKILYWFCSEGTFTVSRCPYSAYMGPNLTRTRFSMGKICEVGEGVFCDTLSEICMVHNASIVYFNVLNLKSTIKQNVTEKVWWPNLDLTSVGLPPGDSSFFATFYACIWVIGHSLEIVVLMCRSFTIEE